MALCSRALPEEQRVVSISASAGDGLAVDGLADRWVVELWNGRTGTVLSVRQQGIGVLDPLIADEPCLLLGPVLDSRNFVPSAVERFEAALGPADQPLELRGQQSFECDAFETFVSFHPQLSSQQPGPPQPASEPNGPWRIVWQGHELCGPCPIPQAGEMASCTPCGNP
jgi:hypothetical protein